VHQYREGKVKSTPTRGVKEFLKPDAYKQSEFQGSGIRNQGSEARAEMLAIAERGASLAVAVLIPDTCHLIPGMTAYLLYNGSASWSW
jgi:hypothetical protein